MNSFNLPTDFTEKYDYLIVHATATTKAMTYVDANWVDREHRERGWRGNGYNAVITRDGQLQHDESGHRCRPYGVTGSHVGGCGPGWNYRSIGVSLAGGVKDDGRTPENNFTAAQFATLAQYIAEAMEAFDIPAENIMGHRDLIKRTGAAPKACPCFDVREWLGDLHNEDFKPRSELKDKRPAKKLRVPATYVVVKGDTLWGIGNTYGVSVARLYELNPGLVDVMLMPGHRLRLLK